MSATQWPLLTAVEPARPAQDGKPEMSAVFRPTFHKHGFPKLDGIGTCFDLFEKSCRLYPDCPCLGERPITGGAPGPYTFMTYKEVEEVVIAVATAYSRAGLKPKDRIGVLGANCKEWMIAMQAMNRMAMVCVPLYETLGDSAVEYIVRHSGSRMVVSAAAKLKTLAKSLAAVKGVVDCGVVYWGAAAEADVQAIRALGVSVRSWTELVAAGRDSDVFPVRPEPSDLCTIMYTSGTTGDPKGVMMPHSAVVSTIASIKALLEDVKEFMGPGDSYLSYLPLAHIFDRVVEELMLHTGASVGYWQGDIRSLMDDVAALKPTLFAGVPRVFERVYNGVMDKVNHGSLLKRLIFNWAFRRKEYYMRQGYKHNKASLISDMLVFNAIKGRLGGRVRVIVSGSAPLAPQIEAFLRVALCAPFVQGYGLTESCAASFIAQPDNYAHLGTVGPPMPATELRLEAVPELGYCPTGDPPRGEVCIRGPALFSGYYGNEEMTKEVMDADGFFHTGDVGEIAADGTLKIIDRKKNIFKLSQGEYIAVEKVENVYKTCPLVDQVWVYGDSLQPCLVAVVVPAAKGLMAWAAEAGVQGDLATVCASPAAAAHVLSAMAATGKAEKLNSLEQVKAVHLTTEPFTVENDLMTPSYKLKRAPLQKRYKKQVDAMYAKLTAEAAAAKTRK